MQGQVFSQRRFFDRIRQSLGSLPVLLRVLLKTGGSMLITVAFYSFVLESWRIGAGVVVLLFVHEAGHLIAARMMRLKVGWPVFIPLVGALIVLKEPPRNAWVEAVVGIGGPLLGTVGVLAVWSVYWATGNEICLVIGFVGLIINLFNLIPIVPLDGGRIVTVISPWLWLLGLVILIPVTFWFRSILVIIFVAMSFPRVIALFHKRTDAERRYFECTPSQRALIAVLYFSLLSGLGVLMYHTEPMLPPPFRLFHNSLEHTNGTH